LTIDKNYFCGEPFSNCTCFAGVWIVTKNTLSWLWSWAGVPDNCSKPVKICVLTDFKKTGSSSLVCVSNKLLIERFLIMTFKCFCATKVFYISQKCVATGHLIRLEMQFNRGVKFNYSFQFFYLFLSQKMDWLRTGHI
jgi:hypothetical protein